MANKQKFPFLLGSKWTAKQKTLGWRHFQVVNRRDQGKWVFAELVASCDPSARFWINAKQLKDPEIWEAGWKTMTEMARPDSEDEMIWQ
ncbi:TIGR02450 family Trp-rich protein [Pannus brasiliensis CCIBt3594]|uniref:TIGR02450 family Trp-rich protein n=1 Tax=Pannus brasiliensis CCIBt3594 TaxID=1427578 RepID=A0AAW9QY20_9CHRO